MCCDVMCFFLVGAVLILPVWGSVVRLASVFLSALEASPTGRSKAMHLAGGLNTPGHLKGVYTA